MNIVNEHTSKMQSDFVEKWDNEIKAALLREGFDFAVINFDDFTIIQREGDPFEHLYYKHGTDGAKRILSWEKEIQLSFKENIESNTLTVYVDRRYY